MDEYKRLATKLEDEDVFNLTSPALIHNRYRTI